MVTEFVAACSFKRSFIVCWLHESFSKTEVVRETGRGVCGKMQVKL